MPGDTLLINNKAKAQHTYDAIVVGSGISGGWAAKELCERGLKVLMLERGGMITHPTYPTAMKAPWEFPDHLRCRAGIGRLKKITSIFTLTILRTHTKKPNVLIGYEAILLAEDRYCGQGLATVGAILILKRT